MVGLMTKQNPLKTSWLGAKPRITLNYEPLVRVVRVYVTCHGGMCVPKPDVEHF